MSRPTAAVFAGLLWACSLLAGCTAVTAGRAQPADSDGPRPVPASELRAALLDSTAIDDVMGASGMTVTETRPRFFNGSRQFTDRGCLVAWTPAEQTVYANSHSTAVLSQTLADTPASPTHFVVQAVVGFGSRRHADDFFLTAAQHWLPCGEQAFRTRRDGGDPAGSWRFDEVATSESTLWMTQRQERSSGWSCQRALRVSNNVAIDVLACKVYAIDEAVTIAHAIDARLSTG